MPEQHPGQDPGASPERRSGDRPDRTLDIPLAERITEAHAAGPWPDAGDGPAGYDPAEIPPPPVDPWADAAPPPPVPLAPPASPATLPLGLPASPATLPLAPPASPATPLAQPVTRQFPQTPRQRAAPPARPPVPPPARPPALPYPPPVPPPAWTVPEGYELRRRRRRWPRRLTWLLLTIGCCCGCPAYFLTPVWQQYPSTATLPAEVVGLTLREDAGSARTVTELKGKARSRNLLAEDTFAAVYDGGPGWRVTVYGTTGFRLAPEHDLDAEFTELTKEFALTDVRDVDPGAPGGYQRCGVGFAGRDDVVLCAWADHGSLGVATFSAGSMDRSAETLRDIREIIITRG